MKKRDDAAEEKALDQSLLTIKESWVIEPPSELTSQIVAQALAAQEPPEADGASLEERQRAFFGVVAWSFAVVFVISSLLTGAALVYARSSRGLLLAMLWGGIEL